MHEHSRSALLALLFVLISGFSHFAFAACDVMINGRPMTEEECATAIQIYGQVIPGEYLMDEYGNWVNINNPAHRGNTYTDAQNNQNTYQEGYGGSWGGGSVVSPRGVYDASGGCEGGSCVNIID